MKTLVAAGATFQQNDDLGARLPLFTNNVEDFHWIADGAPVCRGRRRQDRLALLLRQCLGKSPGRLVSDRL